MAISFLAAQVVADVWGWRTAFVLAGIEPIAMVAVCQLMSARFPPIPAH